MSTLCDKAPDGWQCEHERWHDGTCAAYPASEFCPMHSTDWLYAAVRNNRRLSDLPPQPCACPTPQPEATRPEANDERREAS